jgi:hypothetical protein
MQPQLTLIDRPAAPWRLDDRTRELGRKGVAAARAVLDQVARDVDAQADRTPAA